MSGGSTPPLRLTIVATHPIQYQIPWFRELARTPGVELTVLFALLPDAVQQGVGFGVPFEWDIPLLEGYRWRLMRNVAPSPDLSRFASSRTPGVRDDIRRENPSTVIITGWN